MRNTFLAVLLAGFSLFAQAENEVLFTKLDQGESLGLFVREDMPKLASAIALIYDEETGRPLYGKNINNVVPIASITKLMTAIVVLDARLSEDERITITSADQDHFKGTHSRLKNGTMLTRGELLKLALMSSENVAAAALARTYPGGTRVMLSVMNAKAQELGMDSSRFYDPTGLNSNNVSTAMDLVKLVQAANEYETIHQATTSDSHTVQLNSRRNLRFVNTNPLVRNSSWDIGVSKTGYISEAGRCLVMQTKIMARPVVIVLLDSWGKRTRVGDANRIKRWMEGGKSQAFRRSKRG